MLEGDRDGDLRGIVLAILNGSPTAGAVWNDRLRREESDPTPADRTIGGQAASWLDTLRRRAEAGKLSADRYDNIKDHVERFRDFLRAPHSPSQRSTRRGWRSISST